MCEGVIKSQAKNIIHLYSTFNKSAVKTFINTLLTKVQSKLL